MTDDYEADLRRRAERRADAKLSFRGNLLAYVLVNAGLVAINLITSPGYFWAIWPILGWGLGLIAHGVTVYYDGGDMRERAIEAEINRVLRTEERAGKRLPALLTPGEWRDRTKDLENRIEHPRKTITAPKQKSYRNGG